MVISGTVYFDLEQPSWRLNDLVERAAAEGAAVSLIWKPVTTNAVAEDGTLSGAERLLAAHTVIHDPTRQRKYRSAVFAMLHRHGDSAEDPLTIRTAIKVAGMDWDVVDAAIDRQGGASLRTLYDEHLQANVGALPSIVDGGPTLEVGLSGAAADGEATARLSVIASVLADDALWVLRKPD